MRNEDSTPDSPQEGGEGMDRRTVLKTAALIGTAAVITSKKSTVFAQSAPPPPPGAVRDDATREPADTAVHRNLPVPSVAIAGDLESGADARRQTSAPAKRRARLINAGRNSCRCYAIAWSPRRRCIGITPTCCRPTCGRSTASIRRPRRSISTACRRWCGLQTTCPRRAQNTTFGINEITVHLHNGHTGSESDGFAQDFFGRRTLQGQPLRECLRRHRRHSAASAIRARPCTRSGSTTTARRSRPITTISA